MRMQTAIADVATTSVIASKQRITNDVKFLAANVHARRSRMAEGERLDGLCRLKNLSDLFNTIFPDSQLKGVLDFQRLLVRELIDELSGFRAYMPTSGVELLDWMMVRFQVENLKVLMRACLTKTPLKEIEIHLISLPRELALDNQRLATAESLKDFVRLLPRGILRENLTKALETYHNYPRPFFFEAVLDRFYFQRLLEKIKRLCGADQGTVRPMFCQEVDIFHLMLVARGKFHYNLTPDMLQPLHVAGTLIPYTFFTTMLNSPDLYTSASRVAKRVLISLFEHGPSSGSMIIDVSDLEGYAWSHFLRLANMAFRQNNMGLGAIMGYICLRRVEVANLIAISEGIRTGMTAETILRSLIPRTNVEEVFV